MCGIFAYICKKNNIHYPIDKESIKDSSHKIKHRGPDNSIMKEFNLHSFYIYVEFHRLAIVESSEIGNQPFVIQNAMTKYVLLCKIIQPTIR